MSKQISHVPDAENPLLHKWIVLVCATTGMDPNTLCYILRTFRFLIESILEIWKSCKEKQCGTVRRQWDESHWSHCLLKVVQKFMSFQSRGWKIVHLKTVRYQEHQFPQSLMQWAQNIFQKNLFLRLHATHQTPRFVHRPRTVLCWSCDLCPVTDWGSLRSSLSYNCRQEIWSLEMCVMMENRV